MVIFLKLSETINQILLSNYFILVQYSSYFSPKFSYTLFDNTEMYLKKFRNCTHTAKENITMSSDEIKASGQNQIKK